MGLFRKIMGWNAWTKIEDVPQDEPFRAIIEKRGLAQREVTAYVHTDQKFPNWQCLKSHEINGLFKCIYWKKHKIIEA